jgi:hypothetical protein
LLADDQGSIAAHRRGDANFARLERGITITANEEKVVTFKGFGHCVNVQRLGNQVAIGIADQNAITAATDRSCSGVNSKPLAHQVGVTKLVRFADQDAVILAVEWQVGRNADALFNEDCSGAVWCEFFAAHQKLVPFAVNGLSFSQCKSLAFQSIARAAADQKGVLMTINGERVERRIAEWSRKQTLKDRASTTLVNDLELDAHSNGPLRQAKEERAVAIDKDAFAQLKPTVVLGIDRDFGENLRLMVGKLPIHSQM